MPPRKKGKMPTRGQLRSIVREMDKPPFNARKRTRVSQKKLVARTLREKVPQSFGPVKSKIRPAVGRPGFVPVEQKISSFKETMKPTRKRQTTQSRLKPASRSTGFRGYDSGINIPRFVGIDITKLPGLVERGVISRQEANIIIGRATGNKVNATAIPSSRGKQDILARDMNLTPQARARLDAEEARLAREARLSANLQYEESKRNPRVQNPMKESQARRTAEAEAREGLRAIKKAEKEKERLKKKPLRPRTITPRGGMGIAPIMPGSGGGAGFIKLD